MDNINTTKKMEDATDVPPPAEDRIDNGEEAADAEVAEQEQEVEVEAMDATEDNGNGGAATTVEDEEEIVEEAERPPPRLMITKMVSHSVF